VSVAGDVRLQDAAARLQAAEHALREAKEAIASTYGAGFDSARREQALKGMAAIDAALAAAPTETNPCGHPLTSVVQGDEGTAYCGDCEAAAAPSGPEDVPFFGAGPSDSVIPRGAPSGPEKVNEPVGQRWDEHQSPNVSAKNAVGDALGSGSLTSPGGAPSGETAG
jgi:hypothetical protein